MTPEAFDAVLRARLDTIEKVLGHKAREYARGGDRLHNFHVAARVLSCTPERALWGFAMKHLVSVLDLLDDVEAGSVPSRALCDEKIGDLINYCVLLEACLEHRRNHT